MICDQLCFPNLRSIHTIGDKVSFSIIGFLEIVLHAFAQNNDLVRIFHSIFFALVDKLRAKSWLPFLALPVDAMNGNDNTLPKQFRKPAEKSWSLSMNMYHIVFSKRTVKSRKKRWTYRCKSAPFNGRNRLLTDSLVLRFTSIVIFCTTHMMACSVVASHVTAILCHSGAELFDNDFYSAFSR